MLNRLSSTLFSTEFPDQSFEDMDRDMQERYREGVRAVLREQIEIAGNNFRIASWINGILEDGK